MHMIQIETVDFNIIEEFRKLSERDENIDVIHGRNFNGDLTNIELYVELTIGVIAAITPIIVALIKNHKITSIKVDGDKMELTNVSSKTTEEFIKEYFESKQTKESSEDDNIESDE